MRHHRKKKLISLKHVFHKMIAHPYRVIDQFITSLQENISKDKSSAYYPDTLKKSIEKLLSLILPYPGPMVTLLSKQ